MSTGRTHEKGEIRAKPTAFPTNPGVPGRGELKRTYGAEAPAGQLVSA